MTAINSKASKTYLLDTCVISEIIKYKDLFGNKLLTKIYEHGIACISPYTFWEIKASPVLYEEFIKIFTELPAYLTKSDIQLFEEELENYNNQTTKISPLCAPLMKELYLREDIDINQIIDNTVERKKIDRYKLAEKSLHKEFDIKTIGLMSNNRLDNAKEVEISVDAMTYISIAERNMDFTKKQNALGKEIYTNRFPSLRSMNFIHHYKYGDETRIPKKSDITDILISPLIPYVDVFITEGNLKQNIHQIAAKFNFLSEIEVFSIRDVRSWN